MLSFRTVKNLYPNFQKPPPCPQKFLATRLTKILLFIALLQSLVLMKVVRVVRSLKVIAPIMDIIVVFMSTTQQILMVYLCSIKV